MHSQSDLLCTVLYKPIVAIVSQYNGVSRSRVKAALQQRKARWSQSVDMLMKAGWQTHNNDNANSTKKTFHRGGVCHGLLLHIFTISGWKVCEAGSPHCFFFPHFSILKGQDPWKALSSAEDLLQSHSSKPRKKTKTKKKQISPD